MDWQLIETAPRDGAAMFVYMPDSVEPMMCIASCNLFQDGEDEWFDVWAEVVIDVEPTHWMPLPPPPNAAYIVKSANAYPELVKALTAAIETAEHWCNACDRFDHSLEEHRALLVRLGELNEAKP